MYGCKHSLMVAMSLSMLVAGAAHAADEPATDSPVTTRAAQKDALKYQVVETSGKARIGAIGLDPKSSAGWRELKAADVINAGTQICTGARARVKLVAVPADPPTVLMIEPFTSVQISALEFKDGAAFSRMQIGYGAVRAGVAEGSVRSNMEIASPGAVLSKQGTDIFRFHYYTPNDWGMSLSDRGRGLIQAIQNRNNRTFTGGRVPGSQSRFVRPGQSVNQEMLRTIETEVFSRFVNVSDLYGLTQGDLKLLSLWGNGLTIRGLDGNLIDLPNLVGRPNTMNPQDDVMATGVNNGTTLQLQQALDRIKINQRLQPRGNNAGDFGIGQGGVPINVFNNAGKAVQSMTLLNHAAQKSSWMRSKGAVIGRK